MLRVIAFASLFCLASAIDPKTVQSTSGSLGSTVATDANDVQGTSMHSESVHSFLASLSMIIISELGDKTFLIAALMAMKHPRLLVFAAAFSSLVIMSVLSALLGNILPTILPQWMTQAAACLLFLVFGIKMLLDGYKMPKDASVQEEMEEVEHELEEKEGGDSLRRAEEGNLGARRWSRSPKENEDDKDKYAHDHARTRGLVTKASDGINNLLMLLFSPIFVQTFTLTFLGEWGDRSQIATIAMAAGSDYWWVICGTVLGHGLCTILAVLGGRLLASKISVRSVTLGGGFLFLLFGLIYGYEVFV